jgi:peroxiredoxin
VNKKILSYIITALVIGGMVVFMVKNTVNKDEPTDTGVIVDEKEQDEDVVIGLDQGNTPPDFELKTMTGETVKLSDYKGKKVILNFWASWCGPCKAEMPHMQNYYLNNKESANVEVIAVNLTAYERGEPGRIRENVMDFIEEYGLTFPIPMDGSGTVSQAYSILTIPTTYILGTDGTIAQIVVGPMNEETMENLINSVE